MSSAARDECGLSPPEMAALWCMRLSEGRLTGAQQAEFDAWLDAGPVNANALEEAASTWREFEGAEFAPEFLQMRVEALRQARRPARHTFLRPRWVGAAAAAVVLFSAAVGLWAWANAPAVYRTGVAERQVAVLKDGSKISLDAATTVRVRYSRNRRDLELVQGRAKFDVAKDALRPFSVSASNTVVVATGTQFSVELLQREIHVILYEGHVAVLDRKPEHGARQPLRLQASNIPADQGLTPGRELVVAETSDIASVAPTDPSRALSWEAGQLVFVEEPLSSAVERVNRYSNEKLEIGDSAAGQVRVTGVFTAGDVQAFVEGVSGAFPVRAVRQNDRRIFVMGSSPS